jgi:hypothetical protein
MIGYDSAFIGGSIALTSFKTEFDWARYSTEESDLIPENIVSCYQADAFFGAFFAYKSFNKSRKQNKIPSDPETQLLTAWLSVAEHISQKVLK